MATIVKYWINTSDGYDNRYYTSKFDDEELAIKDAKNSIRRGKDFEIYKQE
jgi:hypothetical protein